MFMFAPRVTTTGGEQHFLQTDGVGQGRTKGREILPPSGDPFGRRQLRAPCTLGGVDQVRMGNDKLNGS